MKKLLMLLALAIPLPAQHLEERPFGTWFGEICNDGFGRGVALRFFEHQEVVRFEVTYWYDTPSLVWFSFDRTYQTGPEWICPLLVPPVDLWVAQSRGTFPLDKVPLGINVYAQGARLLREDPTLIILTQGVVLTR